MTWEVGAGVQSHSWPHSQLEAHMGYKRHLKTQEGGEKIRWCVMLEDIQMWGKCFSVLVLDEFLLLTHHNIWEDISISSQETFSQNARKSDKAC